MTRFLPIAVCFTLALGVAPAAAEPPYPKVDFQGEWVLDDGKGTAIRAQMHYSAQDRKMRMDMNQQGMAMSSVRDMDTGEMIMWSDQMPGMGMRLATPPHESFDGEPTDETKTVNGETCTVWQMPETKVCLTDENIPVEVTGQGFASSLENIQRVAQDAALFTAPDSLQIMDMPANMPGNGPQPGQGMPF